MHNVELIKEGYQNAGDVGDPTTAQLNAKGCTGLYTESIHVFLLVEHPLFLDILSVLSIFDVLMSLCTLVDGVYILYQFGCQGLFKFTNRSVGS